MGRPRCLSQTMKLVHSLSWETEPVHQEQIYCVSPTGPSAAVPEMSTSCPVPGAEGFFRPDSLSFVLVGEQRAVSSASTQSQTCQEMKTCRIFQEPFDPC